MRQSKSTRKTKSRLENQADNRPWKRGNFKRLYRVRFSQVHVWRLLGAMGFSSQKPERRAIERDEAAVSAWKRKTWPALKKSVPPSDG